MAALVVMAMSTMRPLRPQKLLSKPSMGCFSTTRKSTLGIIFIHHNPLRLKPWALLPDIVQGLLVASPRLPNSLSPHYLQMLL